MKKKPSIIVEQHIMNPAGLFGELEKLLNLEENNSPGLQLKNNTDHKAVLVGIMELGSEFVIPLRILSRRCLENQIFSHSNSFHRDIVNRR